MIHQINTNLADRKKAEQNFDLSLSQCAKLLGLKPTHFIKLIADHKLIFKRKPHYNWEAYQAAIDRGLLRHDQIQTKQKDATSIYWQVKVTPKGFIFFENLIKSLA